MKKILLAGIAFGSLMAAPAIAADIPARMPVKAPAPAAMVAYNWSGFYVGGHGGYGRADKCFADVTGGIAVDEGCGDIDGWLAGGQVGFNWQAGQFVFGVEFSGSWADIDGTHTILGIPTDTYDTRIQSIFMATGKLGMAWDRVLVYATGGAAWARDRYDYNVVGITVASARETRSGWTVGGGVEIGLGNNWSLGFQYNYIDLGDRDRTFTTPAGVALFEENIEQEMHIGMVRLNYRFGGSPVVARY
jgi:outer membrane immunogenic protein